MTAMRITKAAFVLAGALLLAATSVAAWAADWSTSADDQLRLNTSITVADDSVRLGDIFSGFLSRPEKIVADAPRPGQQMVLSARWLSELARTYGLDWRPASQYDRAIVYQPGHTISTEEILSAVKAKLIEQGMPDDYGVAPNLQLSAITIAPDAPRDIRVREASFDPASKTFSAVAEIPPGTPDAQFVPMRGTVFPTTTIPVLRENVSKNTIISEEMIDVISVPLAKIQRGTVTDATYLLGKAPLTFLRAGQPVAEVDVAQITLVDVPVLTIDLHRDNAITPMQITYETFDAAKLPDDVILDAEHLAGKTPRRYLAAGAPVRRGDVALVQRVEVPVAVRGLPRGTELTARDINWVTVSDMHLAGDVVTDEKDIIGYVTRHTIRPGQILRNHNVERPTVVERGALVTVIWNVPLVSLSAQGQATEAGGVGDVIRVINTKSKTAVFAEILDSQTVRVSAQQTAMQ